MASRRAIGLDLDPMLHASIGVPSALDGHRADRTGGDAAPRGASRTRIEAGGRARTIELGIDEDQGAKRDPGAVERMDQSAEQARRAESGEPSQLDEVEARRCVEEGEGGGSIVAAACKRRQD